MLNIYANKYKTRLGGFKNTKYFFVETEANSAVNYKHSHRQLESF